MATYFGNDGSVTIGATGVSFNVTQWQASVEIDAAVAPAAFGEDWEEAELTSGRVTGSLTGKLGSDTVLEPADETTWSSFKGELALTMSTGKSFGHGVVHRRGANPGPVPAMVGSPSISSLGP